MKKTKKILSIILTIIMLISIFSITASAETVSGTCGDNLTWTFDGSTLTISGVGAMYGYTSKKRPWEIYEDDIKRVVIEDGVTVIGYYAFYSCSGLISVAIPESVTKIEFHAFDCCGSLRKISIPKSVTEIGKSAFSHCGLTEVTIHDSLTAIAKDAFSDCSLLTNVIIGDGVTSIDEYAFRSCDSLESIAIGEGVTAIGQDAFEDCTSLKDIYYAGTLEQWDSITKESSNDDVFAALTIHFDSHIHKYEVVTTEPTCTEQGYVTYTCLCGYSYDSDYVDPKGHNSLNGIVTKEPTCTIDGKRTYICDSCGEIYTEVIKPLSHTVEKIPAITPTMEQTGLTEGSKCSVCSEILVKQEIVPSIPASGDKLTWIYNDVTCTLTISGTGYMNDYLYNNRPWEQYEDKIKYVVIEDGVTTIGRNAFYDCDNLIDVTIPGTVKTIGADAFYHCSIIKSIDIPDSVTRIGDCAFGSCIKLTDVTISDSVTTIGERAFYNCDSLKSIIIPASVKTIGMEAFMDCDYITNIEIPASVETIGKDAFATCDRLYSITVDENNQYYLSDEENVLYNKDKTVLLQYPKAKNDTVYTIPDSVETIYQNAFNGNNYLETLVIGKGLTTVDDSAFYLGLETVYFAGTKAKWLTINVGEDNESLLGATIYFESVAADSGYWSFDPETGTLVIYGKGEMFTDKPWLNFRNSIKTVIINEGITTICRQAFSSCENLESVTIPDTVTKIEESAFDRCYSLTSITIPKSVTTIEKHATSLCNSIKYVCYPGSPSNWKNIYIGGDNDIKTDKIYYNYSCSHKYDTVITIAPTCEEEGCKVYICTVCGNGYADDFVAQNGHTFDNFVVTKEPGCTTLGEKKVTCTTCKNKYVNHIDATGHLYENVTVVEPSCVVVGYTRHVCKCGLAYNNNFIDDYIDEAGHSYTEVETAPTCTERGYATFVCTKCPYSYSDKYIEATGHSHKPVVTAPTCTAQGYTTYICKCGDSYIVDYVDKIPHDYSTPTYTAPPCTEKGYTIYECHCGASVLRDFVDITGHIDSDSDGHCDQCNRNLNPSTTNTPASDVSGIFSIFNIILELLEKLISSFGFLKV